MIFKKLMCLFVSSLAAIIVYGEQVSYVDKYESVSRLRFRLKNESLMEFFTKLALNEVSCPIVNCNVTLANITDAGEVSNFSNEAIAKALESLKLNGTRAYTAIMKTNMTVNSTLYYLQLFETTFSEIYNRLVISLTNPREMVPNSLKILNVSLSDFSTAIAYGSDEVRLNVLSTGNYSLSNIKAVLNVTQKNVTEILKLIPLNKIFKNLYKVNSTKLNIFARNLGITSDNLNNFYMYLNVSLKSLLKHQLFVDIVDGINKSLNQEEVLSVFVTNKMAITSKKGEHLKLFLNKDSYIIRNYTQLYLESVGNPLKQYQVTTVNISINQYSDEVAHVYTNSPFLGKIVNTSSAQNTSRLLNCTYVTTLPNGGLFVENITHVHMDKRTFTAIKSNKTVYNLGSPLFCKGMLYGLAIENYPKYINFTSFKSNVTIHSITATPNKETTTTINTTPSSINESNRRNSGNAIGPIFLALGLLYIYC